ncbi:hypothetical protein FP2506_17189 [Fulvimarina pelagi HTCC2506]|uniref:Integral membrane protein n=1 Tax=Fulvimarina pelagi HTCC2506 TaxID=314231 RepID=Q0G2J2_9HYPH|nr:anthrone oxygenase family protein [Fulvimarina pelagi]EAU42189.1 hypothetical protein FP2506_17189 [Fulvimarina pelagi HTCC2506]
MSTTFFVILQLSILAYALVAGVFLAFSDFIMRSLALTGGVGGVEAMQVINREVFRWKFMALFLGMAALSVLIAGYAWVELSGATGTLIGLAAVVYFFGCFGVTVAFNVPMNQALAAMELSSEATRDYWLQCYVPSWTYWNSVRAGAAALSAALLLCGLLRMTQGQT